MDVTLSLKPLAYPLYLEPGFSTDTLSTIGEAATLIKALGIEYDRKLHWSFAGTCLVDATRRLEPTDHNRELSPSLAQPFDRLGRRPNHHLLVALGELAANCHLCLGRLPTELRQ